MKLSIIIPVYNGLSHNLSRCLSSIWNQPIDFNQIEVICVDDCSTDGTYNWLTEEKHSHENFIVIRNNVNIRQGGGRNIGVLNASGTYISFIDQDDYYHPNGLSELLKVLDKYPLDVIQFDSACHNDESYSERLQLNYSFTKVSTSDEFLKHNTLTVSPWRYVINRSFYNQCGIKFVENCRIEDVDWACRLFCHIKSIKYEPILVIHYIANPINTTSSLYKDTKVLEDNINASNRTWDITTEDSIKDRITLKKAIYHTVDRYYKNCVISILFIKQPYKKKQRLISLLNAPLHSKYKIVRMAKNSPKLFCILSMITPNILWALKSLKKTLRKI